MEYFDTFIFQLKIKLNWKIIYYSSIFDLKHLDSNVSDLPLPIIAIEFKFSDFIGFR